ncbi:MAG: hypothetical protein LBN22_01180, partial [Clostridiales Family XIII bacterium]|nr:hypothetical protein [Clostridiales Family XIII bacterium]
LVDSRHNEPTVVNVVHETTHTDTVISAPIQVKKVDKSTNKKLAGAGFRTYLISDLPTWNGIKLTKSSSQAEINSYFNGVKRSDLSTAKQFNSNTRVPEIITGQDGLATFPRLPYGSYITVETTRPKDYLFDNETTRWASPVIFINEDSSSPIAKYQVTSKDTPIPTDIDLIKVDADTGDVTAQGDATIKGAKYRLYYQETFTEPDGTVHNAHTQVTTDRQHKNLPSGGVATTDDKGHLSWTNIYPAKYYIQEDSAGKGYNIDQTHDASDGINDKDVTKSYYDSIVIDDDELDLTIYNADGTKTGIIRNKDNRGDWANKNSAVYLVDCTVPANLSGSNTATNNNNYPTKADSFVNYDDNADKFKSENLKSGDFHHVKRLAVVSDLVQKSRFQILKVNSSNTPNQTENALLEGAGFKIYKISDLIGKSGFSFLDGKKDFVSADFVKYKAKDFKDMDTARIDNNGDRDDNGKPHPEIFTDNLGYAKSQMLAYGQYIVVESTIPKDGLIEIKPFVVTIDKDADAAQAWRILDDKPQAYRIKLTKLDRDTDMPVLNKNAKYLIKAMFIQDSEGNTIVDQRESTIIKKTPSRDTEVGDGVFVTTDGYIVMNDTDDEKHKIGTKEKPYTTNEEGTFTTRTKLPYGDFEIEEIEAPDGYVLNGFEGKLHNGYEKAKDGKYTSAPKAPVSVSFGSSMPVFSDALNQDIIEVEQYNDEQKGKFSIEKFGEKLTTASAINDEYSFQYGNAPLEDVTFDIIAAEDIYYQDGQGALVYAKGDKVKSITTDEKGQASTGDKGLLIGKYTLKEGASSKPHGYLLMKDKDFEIAYDDQEIAFTYKDLNLENVRQKIDIKVIKQDEKTGEVVSGASFGLYNHDEIKVTEISDTDEKETIFTSIVKAITGFSDWVKHILHIDSADGSVPNPLNDYSDDVIPADTLLMISETNAAGTLTFKDLPEGKYIVREVRPPNGYDYNAAYESVLEIANDDTSNDERILFTADPCSNLKKEISTEVDKDTIRFIPTDTAIGEEKHEYLTGSESADKGVITPEEYFYDIDYRNTSNIFAEEYVVDDPLEGVAAGQIKVQELWTAISWGDYDGLMNVWYKTNKTKDDKDYSPVNATLTNPSNPYFNPNHRLVYPNTGFKLWSQGISTTAQKHLTVADLGLDEDEYITAIRFEYGGVKKGFTTKNYADESLDYENYDDPDEPSIVDWTPKEDDQFYVEDAVHANGLKPATYRVLLTSLDKQPDIHNSVSTRIATDLDLRDDDEDIVVTSLDIKVKTQIDKDTIRFIPTDTAIGEAKHEYLTGSESTDNGVITPEEYFYDIDYRNTSNIFAEEYVVDDPLEGVVAGQIKIQELWTPVSWGDYDGLMNVWYKTNKTDDKAIYSTASAMTTNPDNRYNPDHEQLYPNTGFKLWSENVSTTEQKHLTIADLELDEDEYITAIRFEHGGVKVGFTTKNYADDSLDYENYLDPKEPTTVDWTPNKDSSFYAEGAETAEGLKPATYRVLLTSLDKQPDIVNSAECKIRHYDLTDDDEDVVVTSLDIEIDTQVDKDTIRNIPTDTASGEAKHDYLYDAGNDSDRPTYAGIISPKEYYYDLDYRSTSNIFAEEYVVDDPLEGVKAGQIKVSALWTPVSWGDYDGLMNVWYKTNKTDDDKVYSTASAMTTNPDNRYNPEHKNVYSNTGYKLWSENVSASEQKYLNVADLKLKKGEYITAIRFEHGGVQVGFTTKNYADDSLDYDNYLDPKEPTTVDWTPKESDKFYAEDALHAVGLKPATYQVVLNDLKTQPDIENSVTAKIRHYDQKEKDTDQVVTSIYINISCEVDKDTIKRTSAAYKSLPNEEGTDNIGSETYKYDIDYRSTSNVYGEEFIVDDILECVKKNQVRIQELWTAVTWGDFDGKMNVWYKTNLTNDNEVYSSANAMDTNPYNAYNKSQKQVYPNTGFKLWAQDVSTTQRAHFLVSDLGLAGGEYITAIRYEHGGVRVGFTSKNYADQSLNDSSVVDWTPEDDTVAANASARKALALTDEEDAAQADVYANELKTAALKPVSYLVYANKAMDDEVIQSSVKDYIVRDYDLRDKDKDTVRTVEINTFTLKAGNTEPDVKTTYSKDNPNNKMTKDGKGNPLTGDNMRRFLFISVLVISIICIAGLIYFKRKRRVATNNDYIRRHL